MCEHCEEWPPLFVLRALALERKADPYGADIPTKLPRPDSTKPGEPTPTPRPFTKPIPVNTRDVAEEMQKVIDAAEPRLTRWLYSTINAQASALKDQEIRNAVRDGEVPKGWEAEFHQSYARFINERLGPEWEKALRSGAAGILPGLGKMPGGAPSVELLGKGFREWIGKRGDSLAVDLSRAQHDALSKLLRHHIVDDPLDSVHLAQYLRPLVGLTEQEQGYVDRRHASLIEAGTPLVRAVAMAQDYSAFLRRRRATRIARTEMAMAYNYGALIAVQNAPLIPGDSYQKVWRTQRGVRTCAFCDALDGQVVGLAETFPGVTAKLPNVLVPPAHPHCRCIIDFELVEGPALPATKPEEATKPKPAEKPMETAPSAPVAPPAIAPLPAPTPAKPSSPEPTAAPTSFPWLEHQPGMTKAETDCLDGTRAALAHSPQLARLGQSLEIHGYLGEESFLLAQTRGLVASLAMMPPAVLDSLAGRTKIVIGGSSPEKSWKASKSRADKGSFFYHPDHEALSNRKLWSSFAGYGAGGKRRLRNVPAWMVGGDPMRKERNGTAFLGATSKLSSMNHEVGHLIGHVNGWDDSPELLAFHRKGWPGLSSYEQQSGPGDPVGVREFLAEGVTSVVEDRAGAVKRYGKKYVEWIENGPLSGRKYEAKP